MARRRRRIDEEIKADLSGKEVREYLRRAGLPKDYGALTPGNRRKARLTVLGGWYDPDRPHVLCTDVEKYLQAHFLWVEFYMKPAACNGKGVYYFDDPLNKYDLLRMIFSPALVEGQPSKTVATATRRMGKTQSCILEAMTLLPICRPFTCCLVSELNNPRTAEEMKKIKLQVEQNERVHSDFGGEGVLYPKKSGSKTWSSTHLQFMHFPGCEILGHSLESAQRGRGPLYGVIDDPEDESTVMNRAYRVKLSRKILDVYTNMFHWGGHILWLGTPVDESSCLALAMRGMVEKTEKEGVDPEVDAKFADWKKGRFPLIVKKEDGTYESMQPERYSVKAFLYRLETDPISAHKEILCEPVTPGTRAFVYDRIRHSYMHCWREENGDEFMLDFHTGELIPWKGFLDGLKIFGAGDLADGQSADADPGALVLIGVDYRQTVFVLDAYNARCLAEKLIEKAYEFAERWNCEYFGWERAALQTVINRMIARYVNELRRRGRLPPIFRELENAKKNKVRRILTMSPLFGDSEIRFPLFDRVELPGGDIFYPVPHTREGHIRELLGQVREYTDEGIRGPDDLIDSLEMALRVAGRQKGTDPEELLDDQHPTSAMLDKWAKVGLIFGKDQLPVEAWTPEMHQDSLMEEAVSIGVLPYV